MNVQSMSDRELYNLELCEPPDRREFVGALIDEILRLRGNRKLAERTAYALEHLVIQVTSRTYNPPCQQCGCTLVEVGKNCPIC